MMYGWIITKDHISGCHERLPESKCCDKNDVGVYGPARITPEAEQQLANGDGVRWRAFDDDGELYYEGLWVGEDDYGLGPLTDFCQPNAGCTRLELFENGKWSIV